VATTDPLRPELVKLLKHPEWMSRLNPVNVKVMFPTAVTGGGPYRFDKDGDITGFDYVPGRWHTVTSVAGKPSDIGDNGEDAVLFDSEWAIFNSTGGVQNLSDLTERANDVATAYYGRLSSGAGLFKFNHLVDMLYGGASMIRSSIVRYGDDQGLFTEVAGLVHDPVYGYHHDKPLTAFDMLSIGPIRAMPRPGGGVLLDATAGKSVSKRVYLARITDTDGLTINASYKAQAIDTFGLPPGDTSRITVPKDTAVYDGPGGHVAPITRPVRDAIDKRTLSASGGPAGLGDLCLIVVDVFPAPTPQDSDVFFHALFAWEEIDDAPCPSAIATKIHPDPIGEAMALTAMGAL